MHPRVALLLAALAGLALLSGCSAAGSLDMDPVDDRGLAEGASRTFEPDPSRLGPRTDHPPRHEIVAAAIENGSTNVTARSEPVSEGLPVAHGGAYYNLTWAVVDEHEAWGLSIGIDYDNGSGESVVDYEDLPAADRRALDSLLPPPPDHPEGEDVDIGTSAVYADAELEASKLAGGEHDAVRYEGERYGLAVQEPRRVTVSTYRYDATQVAPNASAYADHLREAYAFALGDLSSDERSVVEEAIGDTYYADSSDDAAFESVLDRFRDRRAIERDRASGLWLVRYDGEYYLADLFFGGFLGQ